LAGFFNVRARSLPRSKWANISTDIRDMTLADRSKISVKTRAGSSSCGGLLPTALEAAATLNIYKGHAERIIRIAPQ
jgi:hypothetical protein